MPVHDDAPTHMHQILLLQRWLDRNCEPTPVPDAWHEYINQAQSMALMAPYYAYLKRTRCTTTRHHPPCLTRVPVRVYRRTSPTYLFDTDPEICKTLPGYEASLHTEEECHQQLRAKYMYDEKTLTAANCRVTKADSNGQWYPQAYLYLYKRLWLGAMRTSLQRAQCALKRLSK